MKALQILITILLFSSYTYKNCKEETNKYSSQFKKDVFTYKGNYFWLFDLMGGEQVSLHTLYPDSIVYSMKGKAYSTNYTMKKLSYEKDKNKWIGEDENGIIYVFF